MYSIIHYNFCKMKKLIILTLILCIIYIGSADTIEGVLKDEDWQSGYIRTDKPGDNLFYVLVKSRTHNASAPLMVWLNGGPGCSSMYGLFEENGPFVIDRDNLTFKKNPSSPSFIQMQVITHGTALQICYI